MTVQELRDSRAAMVAETKQIISTADAEKRSLTEEEETRFTDLERQIAQTTAELNKAEKRELVEHYEAELKASTGRKVSPAPAVRTSKKSETHPAELLQAWT